MLILLSYITSASTDGLSKESIPSGISIGQMDYWRYPFYCSLRVWSALTHSFVKVSRGLLATRAHTASHVRSAALPFSQAHLPVHALAPCHAELLPIHQTPQQLSALTRRPLLISAQISLSWNWVSFKKFITLKRPRNAKTMPFISLGKETARKW